MPVNEYWTRDSDKRDGLVRELLNAEQTIADLKSEISQHHRDFNLLLIIVQSDVLTPEEKERVICKILHRIIPGQ